VASSSSPLLFEPVFQERIWGGRRLAELYGKKLPANKRIGESWEIVDREEAQSVVANGRYKGKTLHYLWTNDRKEIFGEPNKSARFPLLIKLLDAEDKLSLQVHPPAHVADELGGECKTEFWYVGAAEPEAELFVGLRQPVAREEFEAAIKSATVANHVHKISVRSGDAMFLPSGRFHAVGAGNVLVEIQQNSDTTYRVFDWDRVDEQGKRRQLHIESALRCIDFKDVRPALVRPEGERLACCEFFEVQKWNLTAAREIAAPGRFAIVCCLTGELRCGDVRVRPGELCLVPASLRDRELHPGAEGTSLLRVTIPG
jgi:mannose-6-phosphate isomerase